MLSKIIGANWQDEKPSQRIKAIANLDSFKEDDGEILTTIVLNDESLEVRSKAIEKIENLAILLTIISKLENNQLALARKSASTIIASDLNRQNKEYLESLIENTKNTEELIQLTELSRGELAQRAFSKLEIKDEHLVRIAANAIEKDLKERAVDKISKLESLENLEKLCRNKDKTTHRQSVTRIREIKKQVAEENRIEQEKQRLINAFDNLSTVEYHPLYKSKFAQLEQNFTDNKIALKISDSEEKSILERITSIQKKIEENRSAEELYEEERQLEKKLDEQIKPQLDEINQIQQQLSELEYDNVDSFQIRLSEIEKTYENLQQSDEFSSVESKLFKSEKNKCLKALKSIIYIKDQSAQIKAANDQFKEMETLFSKEDKKPKASFDTSKSLQTLIENIQNFNKSVEWPRELTDRKEVLDLKSKQENLLNFQRTSKELKTTYAKECKKKLNFLAAEIKKGSLKSARRLQEEITLLKSFAIKAEQKFINTKLVELSGELDKAEDWHKYATTPKKEALCENMEALIGSTEKINTLSKSIKSLQDEWKNLGTISGEDGEALWTRFQEAGNKAYEPVKKHYQNLDDSKQKNLAIRKSICTDLENLHNKNAVALKKGDEEWKEVDKALRQYQKQWRDAFPLPKNKENAFQKDFQSQIDKLNSLLDAERLINLGKKKNLCQNAESLAQLEDNKEAINKAKDLQQQWKNVGITDYKEDKKLWQEFRKHCDAIFDTRDNIQKEIKEESSKALAKANEICAQLSDSNIESASELDREIKKLEGEFRSLGKLPKHQQKNLERNFKDSLKIAKQRLKAIQAKESHESLNELRSILNILTEIEHALAKEEHVNPEEIDSKDIQSKASSLIQLPSEEKNELISVLRERIDNIKNISQPPNKEKLISYFKENEQKRRNICVELEIINNAETPSEDQKIKMAIQVERLNKGMKQDKLDDQGKVGMFAYLWICLGSTDPDVYSDLDLRYNSLAS